MVSYDFLERDTRVIHVIAATIVWRYGVVVSQKKQSLDSCYKLQISQVVLMFE